MNKELITKWVEALESNKYAQIQGRLRTDNGHCCLGVLCEVAGIPSMRSELGNYTYQFPSSVLSDDGIRTSAIEETFWRTNFFGLQNQSEYYHMNDHQNMSFAQIAAAIRKDAAL